jgi:hypothetical protein
MAGVGAHHRAGDRDLGKLEGDGAGVAQALLWHAVRSRSANGAFGMCRCWADENEKIEDWLIALTKATK